MTSGRHNTKRNRDLLKADAKKSAHVTEKRPERSWTSVRDVLVDALCRMRDVAHRRSDRRSVQQIDAIKESLRKLDDRIAHHQLPLVALRTTLGDARLDALMIHAQLKIALMYDHQELLAPNEMVRAQLQEYRRSVHDSLDSGLATSTTSREHAMEAVVRDLEILAGAEHSLREEGSEVWNATMTM